jgi:MYXO-CTERM domain-containing protein
MGVTDATVFCEGSACGTDLVLEGEFIAESPVCSGDSGGPALDKNGRVSGVTSRGDQKCTVGIYSGVSAWRDFIIEKTFEAATSGHYPPPAWAGDPPTGFDPGTPSAGSSSGGSGSTAGSSALPLAGGPGSPASGGASASGGTGSITTPIIDPLGLSCTGDCPGSYVCWAVTNKPPGICVPQCSTTDMMCPSEYSCDTELGACLRTADLPKTKTSQSGGCSIVATGTERAPASGAWLGLVLLGALWDRRGRRHR